MSIYYCYGDLLESNVDFICHQVNCQGKMGAGIAKSIRDKWPRVYSTYKDWCDGKFYDKITLGKIQIVDISDGKSVVNMAAQNYYGNHGRFTSYDAFYSCLEEIRNNVPAGSKIGFPYKIGCVRGGASWAIIYTMIAEVLSEAFDVYIFKYIGG